ncbi:MAG: hypothetical protein HWE07_13760 [Cytophagia bacterium]|nr:hypothetical protein [Cytophagia bacterium]
MKKLLVFPYLVGLTLNCYSQDLSEASFRHAVENGLSTAPSIVVFEASNGTTIKEICTDIGSLYYALEIESNTKSYNDIHELLINNSHNRQFHFTHKDALNAIGFENYTLEETEKIESDLIKYHLADSLEQLDKYRMELMDEFYKYSDQRDSLIVIINDSIAKERSLAQLEIDMLKNLHSEYYDYHYNELVELSNDQKQLIEVWNRAIQPFKVQYEALNKELERREQKFFRSHLEKYGFNFCHVAFKFGILFYQGDENPILEFDTVIRPD